MIDRCFAERFAAEWLAAWNAHDLPRILAHQSGSRKGEITFERESARPTVAEAFPDHK
jgi:hypothetical protein